MDLFLQPMTSLQSADIVVEFFFLIMAMIFVACLLFIWRDRHPEIQ